MNKEIDSQEFDHWYINQRRASSSEEIESASNTLIKFLESTKPSNDKYGYTTHFFQHERDEDFKGFFYYDCPLNEKVVENLVNFERVKYVGRKLHQGKKYKSWTFQNDQLLAAHKIKMKEEIKGIINDSNQRRKIIKSAIKIKLERYSDMYLDWLFKNPKFEILSKGFKDFVVLDGKKEVELLENVCQEFLDSVTELQKEEIIRVHPTGYVTPGKKYKVRMWEERMVDPAFSFVYLDDVIN